MQVKKKTSPLFLSAKKVVVVNNKREGLKIGFFHEQTIFNIKVMCHFISKRIKVLTVLKFDCF